MGDITLARRTASGAIHSMRRIQNVHELASAAVAHALLCSTIIREKDHEQYQRPDTAQLRAPGRTESVARSRPHGGPPRRHAPDLGAGAGSALSPKMGQGKAGSVRHPPAVR